MPEETVGMACDQGLTALQAAGKRAFDIFFAALGLVLTGWLIMLAWVVATVDTGGNGFFTQQRVGRHGRLFRIVKIRTMRPSQISSTVTVSGDPRVTPIGRVWRKLKIDELPQLANVLVGHMSFVGPRPDVPGFADQLSGEDRIILSVRPGITGPATLKYRDEEELLASVPNAEAYNRDVVFPDKIRLNRQYVEEWTFGRDVYYIFATLMKS